MKCLLCGSEKFGTFRQVGVMNTQNDENGKVKEIVFDFEYCLGCGNISVDLNTIREVQDGSVWI